MFRISVIIIIKGTRSKLKYKAIHCPVIDVSKFRGSFDVVVKSLNDFVNIWKTIMQDMNFLE